VIHASCKVDDAPVWHAEVLSIQEAIDATLVGDGDTVLVSPGLHEESIDFLGKVLVRRG
jgi:hypothetical protein